MAQNESSTIKNLGHMSLSVGTRIVKKLALCYAEAIATLELWKLSHRKLKRTWKARVNSEVSKTQVQIVSKCSLYSATETPR